MKTNGSMTKVAARVLGVGVALAFGVLVVPVSAEDDNTPQQDEADCAGAVNACGTDKIGAAHTEMRAACNTFRKCKRGCSIEKSKCGQAARLSKKSCKQACKSKSGKAKRSCKKACRAEKRDAKRACRNAKKSCNHTCRTELRDTKCVKARGAFWTTLAKEGASCVTKLVKGCGDAFPKKD